jgi:predicted ATPase
VLARDGRQWRAALPAGTRAVPETVRQMIELRLGRVSPAARELMRVAGACTAGVSFAVARQVAGLEEASALDALDEALAAQLLKPTADPDGCDFVHALVRHTLYEAQSPARRARLHRQLAEAMAAVYGARANEHVAEIARHWHRSASLPGAESGVPFCLQAADQARRRSPRRPFTSALRSTSGRRTRPSSPFDLAPRSSVPAWGMSTKPWCTSPRRCLPSSARQDTLWDTRP